MKIYILNYSLLASQKYTVNEKPWLGNAMKQMTELPLKHTYFRIFA
jgi:hypothetical protein